MNGSPMNETEARATTALQPVAAALEADGYTMSVEGGPEEALQIRIAATDDACEECLAPKTVIQPMVEHLLEADGLGGSGVVLNYPGD